MQTPLLDRAFVKTTVNYYLNTANNSTFYLATVGEKRRKHDCVHVTVEDIRGHENEFSLDVHGFQLVRHTSSFSAEDFDNNDQIRSVYYAECADLLKTELKATHIIHMGHTLRHRNFDADLDDENDLPDMHPIRGPTNVRWAHVDQSYRGAAHRMAMYAENDAYDVARSRWAIVNVWRPIRPVGRDNLAMCDARSVSEEDLVECVAKVYDRTQMEKNSDGEVDPRDNHLWAVRKPSQGRPEHKWYYASRMAPDEVLLLKIFDSQVEGIARRSPHTAFKCALDKGPTRQSLELRCLVFWEE